MTADLYIKVDITEDEANKMRQAITIMDELKDTYAKMGTCSTATEREMLEGAIDVLQGVLEGRML